MNAKNYEPLKITLVSYSLILLLISLIVNSVVLKVFLHHRHVRMVPINVFLASFCGFNLLFTCLALPMSIITLLFNIAIKAQLCFFVRSLNVAYFLVSFTTSTILSIDRYNFIFIDGKVFHWVSGRPLRVVCCIWTASLVYSSVLAGALYVHYPGVNCITLRTSFLSLEMGSSLSAKVLVFGVLIIGFVCLSLTVYCFLWIAYYFKRGKNQLRPIDVPHNRKILTSLSSASLRRCLLILAVSLVIYGFMLVGLFIALKYNGVSFIFSALLSRSIWVLLIVTPCICTRSKIFRSKYCRRKLFRSREKTLV